MGFYGNIVNNINGSITPNVQFQFDKVVSNKFLLDNTAEYDDVYLGRYVLIDYDKDITETIPRVLKYNDKFYYYNEWEAIKNDNPSQDENTIASKLSPIDTYTIDGYVYTYTPKENNNSDTITEDFPSYQNSIFYQWKETEKKFSEENELEDFKSGFQSKSTSFDFNTYIDDYCHYDSTVWQKVYINNRIKYEMIAKLNSDSPEIEYEIIPPNKNGLSSVSSVQAISENKYKILLPMSVGFRINENPYYEVHIYFPGYYEIKNGEEYEVYHGSYNENINYYDPQTKKLMKFHFTEFPKPSDIDIYAWLDGKFQKVGSNDIQIGPGIHLPKLYVLLSDFEINYYSYEDDNTINENIIKKPVSIYYNKDGLLKEQRVHSNNIIPNEIKVIQDGNSGYQYENNKVFYKINIDEAKFEELKNEKECPLYFLENNRYINVSKSHIFNENIQYYIYEQRNEEKEPIKDVNQLTINLPAIGDMVCEGWDKIYGVDRKTGEYDYDYNTNKINSENIPEDLNEDSNSIVGLMNFTKLNLQKLIENQNNNPTMQIDSVANSIPLISEIKVIEDEKGDPIIDENGEQKKQIQYKTLTERSLLQNQIAENNFAIKSILDKTGLTEGENGFTGDYIAVSNVTGISYQPNLYYVAKRDEDNNFIDKDGNIISPSDKDKFIYILDNREQYTEEETYYTYKINRDSVKNNSNASLQFQISQNSSRINTNSNNIADNSTNIAKNKNNIKANDEDLKNITDRIGLKFNPSETSENNNIEIGSVILSLSSDKLYKKLLGISSDNFDTLKKDKELYYKDNEEYKLVTDDDNYNENMTYYKLNDETVLGLIKQNNILINNLAARLISLEKFIEEGHFLFLFGRKNKDFTVNYQEYPIPGSKPSMFPSQDTSP